VRISLFFELTNPRPWDAETEYHVYQDHLEAAELADKLGYHAIWVTEHHFLEEMTHTGAPEIFLAGVATRTKKLRLGHGIVQVLPGINHPARVAERISALDLMSGGRVEFGTGEGSSAAELGGFMIDAPRKRDMWLEGVKVATRCMYEEPFTGFEGEFVTMPPRNVVPKPLQKPHPPVWVACTRLATLLMAAENGIGALSFAYLGVDATRGHVRDYYENFERAVPLVPEPNPNALFSCGNLCVGKTREEAIERIGWRGGFFSYGIAHYFVSGMHRPGRTSLWAEYEKMARGETPPLGVDGKPIEGNREDWRRLAEGANSEVVSRMVGVGSPDDVLQRVLEYEDAGCDEIFFYLPPIHHEWTMESIELLGKHVIPAVQERHEKLEAEKAKRLEPVLEKVRARWVADAPTLDPDYAFGGPPEGVTEIIEAVATIRKMQEENMRKAAAGAGT
jgi:alkanesulfonate monooxygenase SsuD/methylene tetrahydromethanopterin reductase-like flavin-dependent oxidoreductase (luciferase family)